MEGKMNRAPSGLRKEQDELIVRLRDSQRLTWSQISSQLGLSRQIVKSRYLKAKEIEQDTVSEVRKVFEECLCLIVDRDPKYGSQWRKEDLDELWGNVSRKFEGLKYQFKANGKVDMEFPLDLINYTVFFYLRLKE